MNNRQLIAAAAALRERDLALLDGLYEHRFLTRRHLQALYFTDHPELQPGLPVATSSPRPAQRRLRRLQQTDLVVRRRLALPDGRRDPEPYYCLSPDGAQLVALRHNLAARETRQRAADLLANPLFVRHALAGADLHCSLTRAARSHPDHTCPAEWWRGEQTASQRFTDRGQPLLLRPDGYTRYQAGEDIHHLLVEIDLGTMSLPRLQAKLDRYRAYSRSAAWESRYPIFPKLLLLTTSTERIASLHQQLVPLAELVLLSATHADLRQQGPLAAIWQRPGHSQPRPLLEAPR
jgi:Replication-relaxation